MGPVASQFTAVQNLKTYLFKIVFNVNFESKPMVSFSYISEINCFAHLYCVKSLPKCFTSVTAFNITIQIIIIDK